MSADAIFVIKSDKLLSLITIFVVSTLNPYCNRSPTTQMYLNCHSCFSLRYGTLQPELLVKEAKKRGLTTLVLTDINNTSAHFDFVRACENEGIRAFLGIEFRTTDYKPLYIAIARNNEGLYELNTFLTQHSLEDVQLPETAPEFKNAFVIYRIPWGVPEVLSENEFVGIAPSEITRLYSSPWKQKQEKLLALCSISFAEPEDFLTHQLLRAIDQNVLLSRLEPAYNANLGEYIHTEQQIRDLYAMYPTLIANTIREINRIDLSLDLHSDKNRLYFTGTKEDDYKLLEKLALIGMKYRYGEKNRQAIERVKKELKVISEQGFVCYFLIADDIIRYAHSKGYHHIGRGSGANSIIAYCLKITDVDPLELDLYFERFINKHRSSPPDFDLDFCWNERDDVIDYIFKRFGQEFVALMATYSTFNQASIIRELGKVYGLPKGDIDQIANEPNITERHHPLAAEIFLQGRKLQDLPNHLGIHAGGVLITEKPLCNFTALKLMPKGFPIVHFDMHVAEENKFFKFDILSQRGLGHIKDTVNLVLKNKQQYIDIHRIDAFKKDPNIKARLKAAKTIGCFYIESPAMRGLLTKLRCDSFINLVAASSIIRPGVAKSGMMREYIFRFQNQDKIKYLHPKFEEILGETYGVMVYQEDVIKVAHHFGGLDLAEADILRRTMSGKNRSKKETERIRAKYFSNCKSYGYADELAMEVWRQIESFAGFSFCKAHSASFAVESYQSLFLKTYYPMEFMVGVLNNFGGFYKTEVYVHEARMSGAKIEAPCVNHSEYLTTIIGEVIYLGFILLKDLEQQIAQLIVNERLVNGEYQNMEDLIRRTGISKEQINILVRIGALRFTGKTKQELLWGKNQFLISAKPSPPSSYLFQTIQDERPLPALEVDEMEDIYEQIELLGFPLASPFDILETKFRGEIQTSQMLQHLGKTVRMVGYYVAKKDTRTSKGTIMNFGTWIDAEGSFFDSTHFPQSLAKNPFAGPGCYLLKGKVTEDFGFPSLEVEKMARLGWRQVKGMN